MLETMKFTEAKLEQAFIELLEIEGFPVFLFSVFSFPNKTISQPTHYFFVTLV
jgi:hypothetical protein